MQLPRLRAAPHLVAALLSLVFSGCDLPTESPQWEQRWILPADVFSLEVVEILPDNVGVTPDQSAFQVNVDPVVFESTLASLCPLCAALDGQFVPKPPFQGTFDHNLPFPDDVVSAVVRQGQVLVVASNGFGFDPLRPPGGERGSITVVLRDGGAQGRVLDQKTWDGATSSFPPGGTLSGTFHVTGAVGSSLFAQVTVDSPAGGLDAASRVLLHLQDKLRVTATIPVLEVTSATVRVAGREFEIDEEELDVGGVDEEMVDRLVSGAFDLEIENPWAAGATVTFVIDGPGVGAPIAKVVTIPGDPTSRVRVEFSKAELQSFLGKENVTLRGQGAVSSSAAPATLTPEQVLWLDATLDLVLRIG